MKYVIIGLGVFGSSLAEKLTRSGNEVMGVDCKMSSVDALKEKVTHTICLDSTDPQAVTSLPLKDTDIVMVCIGEDEGANIMATALMKKMNVKRLISRAVSPLHQTVLEAMGVDEIVHPEEETADRWAKKLSMKGVVNSLELSGDYSIIEATVPKKYVGKKLFELDFRKKFNVVVLTTIKVSMGQNSLGLPKRMHHVRDVASAGTILNEDDLMVLYGNIKDIGQLLKED
ncbi:MAG: TrkA family potassium uptake protein [Marinoscillum sp.]